jgi:drug/metabolite transporter (DMT)-like permease
MNWHGAGFLFLTSFLWGTNWPVMKYLTSELPPISARAVSVVLGVALARGEKLMPPAGQWRRLLTSSSLNFGAWLGLTSASLAWLRASEAVIIAYTLPVWTMLLALPVLGERLTAARGLGLMLGLVGVGLLMLSEPPAEMWTKLPGAVFACWRPWHSPLAQSCRSARR